MAQTFTLEAQHRTITGKKVGALRRQGFVPGIVYGAKIDPIQIQMNDRSLATLLLKAGGTNIIELNIDGKIQRVLAREVQRDVLRGHALHVDFLAIDATTKLRTTVQLQFVGESPAEKLGIGVLLNGIGSLEVEVLPEDLISQVEIDMSLLKEMNDAIHVRDLKLGDRVTILTDLDAMIVRVTTQTVEAEDEVVEATSAAEPEVIEKGKKEDEDDE